MRISAGTSGYSYKQWKGPFYPERIAPADMLGFYAERLPAVEINNTFYRMPKTAVVESWAAQVPEHFRFSIKATRRITHNKRLKDCGDEVGYLLQVVAALGPKLGVLLFQLPPNLKCDLDRLDAFLALLPEGTPAAFEFRNESWLDDAVRDRLRQHGCALVAADTEEAPPPDLQAGGAFGYLRLRRPDYALADLAGWAERVRGTGWEEAFVFFKHEDAGAGPRMAASFLEVAARSDARGPAVVRPAAAADEAERA